jgi:excisionase family DNA binding protein
MMKLLAANPQTLARVDAVLDGTDGGATKADADCRLVTFTEAAKRLNLSRPTIYRLTKAGRLEVVPLDGVNRIRLKSVIDFANNGGAR